jgi:hypothetical protein
MEFLLNISLFLIVNNIEQLLIKKSAKFRWKDLKISYWRKKFAAPFEFLTAPQSAAAHSLKTTGLHFGPRYDC